ncbi:MAG: bifunctional diaminohydroxyphosphoribosylaminopyrimidine deaminase/5-amino-6-(5-phosphoribosylamino)uracil reductase RibD [Pseudorhodobacter sp.]
MTPDEAHMGHALQLAMRGLGAVWPNPAVGCVLVRERRVVGRGWTQPGGRPHAETRALDQAGPAARGATAYVTLEPCAHHGQTPPCAEALIKAGVVRVVSALTDPDPRVAGRGHAMLRAAGIKVDEGIGAGRARRINTGFFKRVGQGLPMITLKLAATLDGRIATRQGESRWITGKQARRAVHAMRLAHDAVMVGSGTVRADDPDLTVRDMGATRQPMRIVIDSALSLSPDSRLGRTAREVPVWLLHAAGVETANWHAGGARLFATPCRNGRLDLREGLKILAAEGVTRIFCEGGAGLAAALMREGLVDEIALFSAGRMIGEEGRAALGPLDLGRLADAPGMSLQSVQKTGPDLLSLWSVD